MDRFKGLKIGIQGWTLRRFGQRELIDIVASLGLKYLEPGYLGEGGVRPEDPDSVDAIVGLCEQNGVEMTAYNAKIAAEPDAESLRPAFDVARRLGVGTITGGMNPICLPALDSLAEEYDMKIGMHNHGPGGIFSDLAAIEAILRPYSNRIGLCVDTGHYLRLPLDPIEVILAFKDRLHAVHLRDMDPDQDPIKGDGGNYVEHVVGEGPLDLRDLLNVLVGWEYSGTVALEYKPQPENPIPDLQKALGHIEASLGEA